MNKKYAEKYIVNCGNNSGWGDIFTEYFDTLEEANNYAEYAWNHLTNMEKAKQYVEVGVVDTDMLDEDAFDEEGNVEDWSAYSDYDVVKGALYFSKEQPNGFVTP